METLTIEIPDKEDKIVKTEAEPTPNALTIKTIKDAHKGKGIDKPIKNVRSFIDSLSQLSEQIIYKKGP